MTKAELQEFLTLIFYPREMLERLEPTFVEATRRTFVRRVLRDLFTVVRALAKRYSLQHVTRMFPSSTPIS